MGSRRASTADEALHHLGTPPSSSRLRPSPRFLQLQVGVARRRSGCYGCRQSSPPSTTARRWCTGGAFLAADQPAPRLSPPCPATSTSLPAMRASTGGDAERARLEGWRLGFRSGAVISGRLVCGQAEAVQRVGRKASPRLLRLPVGGCGPLLGLLGLSSVLAAVCCRLSVVRWRGFSQTGGAKQAGGSGGWGRGARRRCVWVSARTGGGGLDGQPGPWPSRAERRQLQRSRAARRLRPPAGWRLRRWCWLRPQLGPGPLRRGRRPGGSRQCPAAWRARGGHGDPARGHRRCLR